jgi:hypothetical protein
MPQDCDQTRYMLVIGPATDARGTSCDGVVDTVRASEPQSGWIAVQAMCMTGSSTWPHMQSLQNGLFC